MVSNYRVSSDQVKNKHFYFLTSAAKADANGNLFNADANYNLLDQPLTTLGTVDPLLRRIHSNSLNQQNEEMVKIEA